MGKTKQNNYDMAMEIQSKFWFYFLALTFTILGLSIQTASLGNYIVEDIFEVVSWISLLISGVVGLSRIDQMPKFFYMSGKRNTEKEILDRMKSYPKIGTIKFAETGEVISINEFLKTKEEVIEIYDEEIGKLEKWGNIKYHLQKMTFLLGIILIIVARTIPAIKKWL